MDRPRRAKRKSENVTPHLSREERQRIHCAAYRARVKADPSKYAEFRRKNAQLKRVARLKATPEQKDAEREKARIRQAAYRQRKKAKFSMESLKTLTKHPETRTETRKVEDKRLKNRLAQQKRRAKMSSQKKRRERKRNRSQMQKRRASIKGSPPRNATSTPVSENVSRSTIHRLKKHMGNRFLLSLKGLIRSTARKRSNALQKHGISYSSPSKPLTNPRANTLRNKPRNKFSLIARRLFTGKSIPDLYKRKKFKDNGKAAAFFNDNSTQVPGKLGITKKGSKKVLSAPIKSLYGQFEEQNGPLISKATFFRKRPKHILSFTRTPFRQCLCELCINPMLMMKILNRFRSNVEKVETLHHLINMTICEESMGCMNRECDYCGVHVIDDFVNSDVLENEIEWQRWEKVMKKGSNTKRIDLVKKTGTVRELCCQLKADLLKLPMHDFVQRWQSSQYRTVVSDIPGGWAVLTMDFSENYLCRQQDQPQSAYFGYTQVTVHPCVLYYKCACDMRVTENWTFVSDVLTHSSCMVDAIMKKVIDHVCSLVNIQKLVIFSDGCSSQYKSKLPFSFLSRYAGCCVAIERCYFGARHGKNPCDALGGLLKQAAFRAVQSRKCVIQNALDLWTFAKNNLEMNAVDCNPSKPCHTSRHYFLLEETDIIMKDSSHLKTILGTRKIHSILPTENGLLFRNLSCFCLHCVKSDFDSCINKHYVKSWQPLFCKKNLCHLQADTVSKNTVSVKVPSNSNDCSNSVVSVTDDCLQSETFVIDSFKCLPLPHDSYPREEFFSNALAIFSKCNSFPLLAEAVMSVIPYLDSYPIPEFISRSIYDCEGTRKVDMCALKLRPDNLPHLFPLCVAADGNCMPRALSVFIFGSEEHHIEVRVRIIIEMAVRKGKYVSLDKEILQMLRILSDRCSEDLTSTYELELIDICKEGCYMGMWQLMAAANAFSVSILSIYPHLGQQCNRNFFNRHLKPDVHFEHTVIIFWSSLRDDMNESYWVANHVVPMLPLVAVDTIEVSDDLLDNSTM